MSMFSITKKIFYKYTPIVKNGKIKYSIEKIKLLRYGIKDKADRALKRSK